MFDSCKWKMHWSTQEYQGHMDWGPRYDLFISKTITGIMPINKYTQHIK